MQTFLKYVAEDLFEKLNGDFSRTAIVFPNKRAGLFFNEYLSDCTDKPLWAPAYITISDLFRQLEPDVEIADPIKQVCELYEAYIKATASEETLDEFYFWGEMLLSDFDDVDKNMADADRLFSNLKDLKEYDNADFLTPEQEAAIQQFFTNFSLEKRTYIKDRFIQLWNVLGQIYHNLRNSLQSQGLAYEGMLYRQVAEQMDLDRLKADHYVFVGFNVLNRVEQTLFNRIQSAGKALFYFDYDESYLNAGNEAGTFIQQNLKLFPNELPASCYRSNATPKKIRFISSPSENGQARYIPEWLKSVYPNTEEKENAIVLCNEAILQPVIHSLDDCVKQVNVTMGFPLSQTPVYSFVSALFELQTAGYDADRGRYKFEQVATVLKHPYTHLITDHQPEGGATAEALLLQLTTNNRFFPLPSELQSGNPILLKLFTPCTGNGSLCRQILDLIQEVAAASPKPTEKDGFFEQLYSESLFQAYCCISRISNMIESGELKVQSRTLWRLMTKILSGTTIPFHGEPAVGLQVMGVLETRNLDFRNLLMLSLNEGQLPKASSDSSFIPYNLRKAFGLTTIEKKIAVYAYYFYRLMQRAENITLMYNNASDGLNAKEMSRFMLQYLVESPHPIQKLTLQAPQQVKELDELWIKKDEAALNTLLRQYDLSNRPNGYFSPTALNTYLTCKIRFYFKYIAHLKPKDEVSTEIDSASFGSIFHEVAENIYNEFKAYKRNGVITEGDIQKLLDDPIKIERMVDDSFKHLFFKIKPEEKPEYNGIQLINRAVIIRYIRQLLQKDLILAEQAPFVIKDTETEVSEKMAVETPRGTIQICIGGKIDRTDIVKDPETGSPTIRIVDYKTGGSPHPAKNVDSLFLDTKDRANYIFQTFVYSSIVLKKLQEAGLDGNYKIAPSLLYIHKAAQDDYSPVITMGNEEVSDYARFDEEFREKLNALLQEIFDDHTDYTPTEVAENCSYCDFKNLCHK